jgi:8-amino-7-oxononanoate synthase
MFDKKLIAKLNHQKQTGLYRNPPEISNREGHILYSAGKKMINFASNDYLGLGSSDLLKKITANNFSKFGSSASSSRLVTGNFSTIRTAEKAYAQFFGFEDALFFSSGYLANMALISTLFDKGDKIIFDKHIHASSVNGISLSGAEFSGYRHNSMPHLVKRLEQKNNDRCAVITEALFSMDGDIPDMDQLKQLKNDHNFLCIVDEAHSYGAMGKGGRGIAGDVADIGVGTFGKAFGLFGAFILLSELHRDYLVNFASPFIYTTSLPEAHAATATDLIEIIENADEKRKKLKQISFFMKKELLKKGFKTEGDAHILSIEIGNEEKTVAISEHLRQKNIFVFPARFPTVPFGKAILRLSLTALHTERDIKTFISELLKCEADLVK